MYCDGIDTPSSGHGVSPTSRAVPSGPSTPHRSAALRTSLRASLRRRAAPGCAAVVILALGLFTRTGLPGVLGDASGGILYAALMYLLLAFVLPGARCLRAAAAAVVVCVLIELFQLTPYPAQWGAQRPLLRLVLGSTFNPWDLPAYAAGAACACLMDLRFGRRTGTFRRAGRPLV